MTSKFWLVSILLIIIIVIAYLFYDLKYQQQLFPGIETPELANPASVHCEKEGGKLEIIDTANGQQGLCHLPNGNTCDEWAFYKGECI
ncbi:DUF333 domain-containing protein [Patescibacteria group bacterium]|nr:DUF333 domain-containing protein [Patescibacteria group bacterium]